MHRTSRTRRPLVIALLAVTTFTASFVVASLCQSSHATEASFTAPPSDETESSPRRSGQRKEPRAVDRSARAKSADREAGFVLEAGDGLQWRKGNLHTHSHWSDGDDYLESIGLWYRQHGYDFLSFTDHNVLADRERWVQVDRTRGKRVAYEKLKRNFPDWVDERTTEDGRLEVRLRRFDEVVDKLAKPGAYLLIQGEEISDRSGKYPVHLNAHNLAELVPPMRGGSVLEVMQNNVNAVLKQRERTGRPMFVHLNHPNFGYAVTAEDLARVRGENFFEVYNGHPGVNDSGNAQRASTERIWDVVLTLRLAELDLPVMWGLATDDGHNYHRIPSRAAEPGRGWVQVLAQELTPAALVDALEAGRFYASSGVELSRIASDGKSLQVAVAPEEGVEYTIEFLGTRKDYDASSEPVTNDDGRPLHTTRRYGDDVGAVLKSVEGAAARYDFTGDELYVRARVTSSKKHPNPSEPGEFERAWVQPVVPAEPR